jgi:hypothetical protein
MAILNFPKFPNPGDLYTPPGSTKSYRWTDPPGAWLIEKAQTTATTVQASFVEVTTTTNAISTETGALIVRGGVGIAKDLYVGGQLYTNGVPVITTASFNISEGPDGGTDINIQHYTDTSTNTSTILINNISTLASVTGRGATTSEIIRLTNTTNSTATNNGALIVSGGVGITGRVNTESIKIADTVFDSTKTTVDTIIEHVIDTYLLSEFRSSKYFIQIGESADYTANPRFQAVEITLTAKNDGTPYLTQYGQVTTDGELGTFSANGNVSGGDVIISLTFTPIDTERKTIKVLRTAMVS